MKALSVRAPWWWYILHAGKDIENRDWSTSFRGTVYLHASKWYVRRDVVDDIVAAEYMISGLKERREVAAAQGNRYSYLRSSGGCVVGTIDIVDCVTKSDSPWFNGKFGFVLANPVAFAHPIPFPGKLGLFEVPNPHLRAQSLMLEGAAR